MLPGISSLPGISAAVENTETALLWEKYERLGLWNQNPIVSTAVDSGNTPTTNLRAGLVMGKITASGKLKQWDPTAVDGSEVVAGVLLRDVAMINPATQAVADQIGYVAMTGYVKAADMLICVGGATAAFNTSAYENVARTQMSRKFLFDDEIFGGYGFGGPWMRESAQAADYTVLESDQGTLFTTLGASGAVIFTLPVIRAGLGPFEFLNLVDQNMTILSNGSNDNIVWDHDLSVDSLAFSTSSHKIGGRLQFKANAAGTKWYVRNLSPLGCVVTAS